MSAIFNTPFTNSGNYTYDSDYVEFTGTTARLKDLTPSDALSGAIYTTNINLQNWSLGSITGTAHGGASVSGGKLDLAYDDVRYVEYDATGNADSTQTGAVRFKYTPNYSGSPSANRTMFIISKALSVGNNLIHLRHQSTGSIQLVMRDYADANLIVANLGSWSPNSGQEYEIELNWNLTSGATRLFIDGVQQGSTQTATGTRDSNIGLLLIGSNYSGSDSSNFYIDDFIYFSTVQHTSNYTPGYTVPETKYKTNNQTVYKTAGDSTTNVTSWAGFTATELGTGSLGYQLSTSGTDWLYWDGSAWADSGGTTNYNSASIVDSNISSFPTFYNKIFTRTLFISDGSQRPEIDNIEIEYEFNQAPTVDAGPSIPLQYNGVNEGDSTTPFAHATVNDPDGDNVTAYYRYNGSTTWNLIGTTGSTTEVLGYVRSELILFSTSGLVSLTLKIVDEHSSTAEDSLTVDVNAYPTIQNLNPVSGNENDTIYPFSAVTLSDNYGGSISSSYYKIPSILDTWTFIGTTETAVQGLNFVATTYGDYVIHLKTYDTLGAATESTTTYQINARPVISGLSNFSILDNTSTTPFGSVVLNDPDGSIVKTQYKVIGEVDTWTDIATTGDIQQQTRDFIYTFNNPGNKTVWLLTEDNDGATTADSITVTVNYAQVTFNVKDNNGNHLSNIIFFRDNTSSTATLENSPFTEEYEIDSYDPIFRIPGYVDKTIPLDVSSGNQITTVTMEKILTDGDIPAIVDQFLDEILDSSHRTEKSLGWWTQVIGGLLGVNMTARPNQADDLETNDIRLFETSTQAQNNYDNESSTDGNWFRVQTSQTHGTNYIVKYLRKQIATT